MRQATNTVRKSTYLYNMKQLAFAILFISVVFCRPSPDRTVHDVTAYGATGDGTTTDTPAFEKAWDGACNSKVPSTLLIPAEKTFLTYPFIFRGPCEAPRIEIQVLGNMVASTDKSAWTGCPNWISFVNIFHLTVIGTGEFNGRGDTWWTGSLRDACKSKPTSLHFDGCNHLSISGIKSKHSPRNHIGINRCNNVKVSNIEVAAPGDSPNTDGIDIAGSTGVNVTDSVIGSGDDCIAINNHCSDIKITNIKCGPGHGISVGSLGKNHEIVAVENILVQHCTITGTQNGARIKTWKGGSGYAKSITYNNITLVDVENPIIINQRYVDTHGVLLGDESAVEISDVTFKDIKGTTDSKYGIELDCTSSGCSGITIEDVDITSTSGGVPLVNCANAHGKTRNTSPVINCLTKEEEQSFFTLEELPF